MKNKKLGIILISLLLIGLIFSFVYFYYIKEDNKTTFTLAEKQWMDNSKNKVFDISITKDIPVFNHNGEGVFFDFLNSLEKDTSLEFNKMPLTYGDDYLKNYAFQIKEEADSNDIILYEDKLSLISNKKIKYTSIKDLDYLKIGVLDHDLEKVKKYLNLDNVTYETFENHLSLLNSLEENESINAIILPELVYFKEIIKNDSLNINFVLEGLTEKYVLTLGSNDKLNNIINKYYSKWYKEEYKNSLNRNFTNEYFAYQTNGEKNKVDFRAKRYVYGFIENKPYDALSDNKLLGINSNILRDFSKVADIEISYVKFNSVEELTKAFNENKIDFMYDIASNLNYSIDTYKTVSNTIEENVILSNVKNNILINSIAGLKDKNVMVLKNTKLSNELREVGALVKEYDSITSLLNNRKETSIIALDKNTYEYYSRTSLKKFIPVYSFSSSDTYGYLVRDISSNKVFEEFLSFYLSFVNTNQFINSAYNDLLKFNTVGSIILSIAFAIVTITFGLFATFKINRLIHVKRKQASLTKGDRIRYIDQLTSLKNRNYLNDNIESWDESEVYPQSIVIVDLNNIAYINDNYGHNEGDNVIKEAANVLIKTQIANSDIIRTNGNEFLIYLVGYDEKQIVSYTKKLNKELKELAHGFGAAIGYSMINDAIKTIDDAVNEATLDMRAIKEELNNN